MGSYEHEGFDLDFLILLETNENACFYAVQELWTEVTSLKTELDSAGKDM